MDTNNEDASDIKSYTTDSHRLEGKLFGILFVHSIREYLDRIEQMGSP